QVRPDGKITMPLLGDIDATDRTPLDLRESITKSLKEYVTNPTVTVIVVEALASRVYVMGEVGHPGTMDLHGPTTILQALAMAGLPRRLDVHAVVRLFRNLRRQHLAVRRQHRRTAEQRCCRELCSGSRCPLLRQAHVVRFRL